MFFFLEKIFKRALGWSCDFWNIKLLRKLPCFYYSGEPNVGDSLNVDLLEMLSGKKIYLIKTKYFKHVLSTGSIIHHANHKSQIFGSGLISDCIVPKSKKFGTVAALRGEYTKAHFVKYFKVAMKNNIPLGDPAVLLPKYFELPESSKQNFLGIIPHYVDKADPMLLEFIKKNENEVCLIDIQKDLNGFLKDISQCQFVISSSLHGLIISDAYRIPNRWVRFSDRLVGGDFKFLDYYSTTSNLYPNCFILKSETDFQNIFDNLYSAACVNDYTGDKHELEKSFQDLLSRI